MAPQLLSELVGIDELLVSAVPGPVGATSRWLLILLGLYLMYRRLANWAVSVVAILAAIGTMMLMPVRIARADGIARNVVAESGRGGGNNLRGLWPALLAADLDCDDPSATGVLHRVHG